MRRVLLLCMGLALFAVPGWTQNGGFIRYERSGGGFTAPLLAPAANNCAAIPYGFAGDSNTGICSSALDTVDTYVAGAARLTVSNGYVTVNGNIYTASTDTGSVGYPGTNLWQGVNLSRYVMGAKSKSLTDAAAATPFVTIPVATNGWIAGELIWAATSVETVNQLTATGRIRFAGADTAGTPVCTINVVGTDLQAVSGGANTLVCTWTNVVSTTNCALSVTCTNNTAGSQAITLWGRLDMPITAIPTFN